jgi:Protein of unknown function (DUF1553)/Protein of unknown function (DUF1549)/Planctomycete cytochrome C
MMRIMLVAICLWLSLFCSSPLHAADDGIAFFEQKIRPVLIEHCYECHSGQAKKLKSNLFLDSQSGWEKGGDYGEPSIIPGKPDESLLIRSVQHRAQGLEMPPGKPKLPDAVIADLVTWVKMGAPDPRDDVKVEVKRADKSWWSLQPLKTELKHNSIDDYVLETLAENGLDRNPPADPRSLIRRMTYDLHGLPPTREEVDAFTTEHQSDAKQAVKMLVDRLLTSQRYGERWGRHWLDVIRFGESNGFERNFIIDDLYPFRDYVIQSINADKPFNQFIVEHLAGDEIGKDIPQTEIGSAFLVAGPYDDVGNQDVVAQANIRAATIDDMITATGGAFLGLSINCARCHHHKFDPIPTEDYYRIRAAFEGVTHGRRVVATAAQRASYASAIKPLNQELKKLEEEKATLDDAIDERAKKMFGDVKATRPKVDQFGTSESFAPVDAKFVKFVILGLTSDGVAKAPRNGQGGKLTEFQVWSDEAEPRNVALASNGTTAEGAKSTTAEDFPEAYGPQYCIDGMRGEAWFIGNPAVLTLTFAKPERIREITFINARGDRDTDESKVRGATPCEYEVQVSIDGQTWQTVATDEGREPWTPAHGIAKVRREVITDAENEKLKELDKQIASVKQQITKVPKLPEVWAGKFSQPKDKTFVHQGGDPMKPVDEIAASSLSVLDKVTKPFELDSATPEGKRRLALAEWITSPENPLTPRVLANRVWQYHFGTGIVDTPSDFGFLGSQPSHPELLDYLANRLIANEWRLKALHREILLSQTYLQSSAFHNEAAGKDKAARLLWRYPPRRLNAEEIRDTILMASGKLQLEPMGGPGFRLYKFTQNNVCTYFPLDVHGFETFRRAVYHQNARASIVDVLNDFDLPDIAFAAPKRANTTTPLQALTLLNHSFTLDMAEALSERIEASRNSTPSNLSIAPSKSVHLVSQAFRIAYQREPRTEEQEAACKLIEEFGLQAFCRALLNSNELIYID